MRKILVWVLISSLPFSIFGQGAVGTWRDHFSFRSGQRVTASADRVFVAVSNGVFWYDLNLGSLETLTTVKGLNDVDVSALGYSPYSNLLLVGYGNGNIDLVYPDRIVNLPFIMQKPMQGSKSINDFFFIDNERVFVSTGFGIVVLNLSKNEISDTYYIGTGGSGEVVWKTVLYKERIYAATDNGIYSADALEPNLFLFSNWLLHTEIPFAETSYNTMAVFDGHLLINQSNATGIADVVRVFNGNQWDVLPTPYTDIFSFKATADRFAICSKQTIAIYKNLNAYPEEVGTYGGNYSSFKPNDVVLLKSNMLAVADNDYGMALRENGSWKTASPNGPFTDKTYYVYQSNDKMYVTAGGRTDSWGNMYTALGYHVLSEGRWGSKVNADYWDAVRIIENPFAPGELYIGSWGDGLVVYRDGQVVAHYDPQNSSLQSILPGRYCRVGGLAFDKNRYLWVTNSGVPNTVSVLSPEGVWKGFSYQSLMNTERISDIVYSPNGYLWVISPTEGGFLVIDPGDNPMSQQSHTVRAFKPVSADGESLPKDIYSIAFDRNGYLWIGTTEGVMVSYNPGKVLDKSEFSIQRVKIPDVVEDVAAYLLEYETITSIAIDGANRKWFGTMRSGVFLHSADGVNRLHHFNKNNSPLPSNTIQSINIHPKTGEVFIATDKGLVSYRSDATEPSSRFGKVYAFPNPIRPNYHGIITITGLMDKTTVKITDAAGNLVYETESLGGQATWDGKNRYGDRVASGVYLFFCSDRNGEETAVGKLLFIH